MWLLEDDARRSEIHTLWDAFFFSTVQLLTVSSQMAEPGDNGRADRGHLSSDDCDLPREWNRRRIRVLLPLRGK
jgi:hypothetical protein